MSENFKSLKMISKNVGCSLNRFTPFNFSPQPNINRNYQIYQLLNFQTIYLPGKFCKLLIAGHSCLSTKTKTFAVIECVPSVTILPVRVKVHRDKKSCIKWVICYVLDAMEVSQSARRAWFYRITNKVEYMTKVTIIW